MKPLKEIWRDITEPKLAPYDDIRPDLEAEGYKFDSRILISGGGMHPPAIVSIRSVTDAWGRTIHHFNEDSPAAEQYRRHYWQARTKSSKPGNP